MKRTFYRHLFVFFVFFLTIASCYSIPAIKTPVQIVQPDGSTLTIRLHGDEFSHYKTTIDGYVLQKNERGFYTYALQKDNGELKASNYIAKDLGERSASTVKFLKKQPIGLVQKLLFEKKAISKRLERTVSLPKRKSAANGIQRNTAAKASNSVIPPGLINNYVRTGSPKSLVILVNFKDTPFSIHNSAASYSAMLNQVGYNESGHVGSVRDYYMYNSAGVFQPNFVVVGPVTVSENASFYGANDQDGYDVKPDLMVKEACLLINDSVDFSEFDFDYDGYVDNVYIYYAGRGEADGGDASTIWPHSGTLNKMTLQLDGKDIEAYACSNELNYILKRDGIGTFTHEYGHIIGLPDMYDVDYGDYNGLGFDLNEWSLMASGSYNNNSRTPPCLSIVERTILGWANPNTLDSAQMYTLTDFGKSNYGYKLETSNPGEYYLLENRQLNQNVWDAYLPGHGLLIYHVDMRENDSTLIYYYGTKYKASFLDLWTNNLVNASSVHQCCDLEEADNVQTLYSDFNSTAYYSGLKGDPFPGTSGNGTFNNTSKPAAITWNLEKLTKPITNILETNAIITFDYKDYAAFANEPIVLDATAIRPFYFTSNWNSVLNADSYHLKVFTRPNDQDSSVVSYVPGYENLELSDTFKVVYVPNDNRTYFYNISASNGSITSSTSKSTMVVIPEGIATAYAATNISNYSFKASWEKLDYVTSYLVDVFTMDETTGDTLYLDGFKNYNHTDTALTLYNLEDQTNYFYRVRGNNGVSTTQYSNVVQLTTSRAKELSHYVEQGVLWVKGMDKGGQLSVYEPSGKVYQRVHSNHLAIPKSGLYFVTAPYKDHLKSFKILVK